MENQGIAEAELRLAIQTLEEHTIRAPFDGIVIKRMKHPGESVRANEAVVLLGNLNQLAADAYVPLEYAFRVKEDQIVEIQPQLTGARSDPTADREEAIPRQDHLRRSRDPADRRGRRPRPRRVREPRELRPQAGPFGADDDLRDPGSAAAKPPVDPATRTARAQ